MAALRGDSWGMNL
jgi:hypothetical protein